MSQFRRRLMIQSGGDSPNLATVTEGSVSFDAVDGSRKQLDTPIRADIKKGNSYNVSFDVELEIDVDADASSFAE